MEKFNPFHAFKKALNEFAVEDTLSEISDSAKKKAIEKFKKERPEATDANIKYYVDKFSDKQSSSVFKEKDIFRYTFDELEKIIDSNFPTTSGSSDDGEVDFKGSEDVKYNENGLLILLGDLKDKCIRYGKGESWCISRADNRNMFYSYRMRMNEPVFYFVFDEDKTKDDKYSKIVIYVDKDGTYHLANKDNTGDEQVSWSEIEDIQPKLKGLEKIFKHIPLTQGERDEYQRFKDEMDDEEYADLSDIEKEKYIKFGHDLTEEQVKITPKNLISLYAVTTIGKNIPKDVEKQLSPSDQKKLRTNRLEGDPDALSYIDNPTEEEQLIAVKRYRYAIKYIKNPSEEVQLAAVSNDGEALNYIKNPSEEVQLVAVNRHGIAIDYIKNPSEEIQLAAVQQNGEAIKYIENPSEKVQLAAVKSNAYGALRAIYGKHKINPSEEVQLAAVKSNASIFRFLENPSEKVQLAAVNNNGNTIQYIKDPSEKVQLAAVKEEPLAIMHIKNPFEEVQLAAVNGNKYAAMHIENPTEKVKKLAPELVNESKTNNTTIIRENKPMTNFNPFYAFNKALNESNNLDEKKKPSAGLTKKEKSAVVKKAVHGEDIGKKGKGFEKLAAKAAKEYGSKEKGQAVAAAAMWKGVKREGKLNEVEDLGLALAQVLSATPIAAWAGFTWAKAILAIPEFKEKYNAASSKEEKMKLIKSALGYVFDPTNAGSYTDDNKLGEGVENGGIDYEGSMSKIQLSKIAEYAQKVHDMLEDDTQLDAWVQDHIAQAAELMDQVGHFMEHENKEGEESEGMYEKKLTKAETKKKEEILKGMKKKEGELKGVNYAVATKIAKDKA